MEDAATAEISRAQVWQWVHHRAALDDGRAVTPALVARVIDEEMGVIAREVGDAAFTAGRYAEARELFEALCVAPALADFLTIPAYDRLERDAGTKA
jgi:malate synthase